MVKVTIKDAANEHDHGTHTHTHTHTRILLSKGLKGRFHWSIIVCQSVSNYKFNKKAGE